MKAQPPCPSVRAALLSVFAFAAVAHAQVSPDDAFRTLVISATPRAIGSGARTPQQLDLDRQQQGVELHMAADRAKQFYVQHPAHPKAREARKIEVESLLRAVRAGAYEHESKAVRLASDYRADGGNPRRDRFEVAALAQDIAMQKRPLTSRAAILAEYEKTALELLGEFHDEPAAYDMLLGVARNADPVRARAMADRVLRMPAPAAVKEEAHLIIGRLDMPGKAIALEWQDDSGKSHKITDYGGKVVVFYVWAAWTPASLEADGKVRTLVPSNAILVSVNVDTNLAEGRNAAARSGIAGIRYYDTRGIQGPLPRQLRVSQVPAVHVVDPRGKYVGAGDPRELPALLQAAGR
jgi:hypothetical protein